MFQIPLDHSKSIVTAGFDWSGEQILSHLPVCYRRCTPYVQSTYIVQSIMQTSPSTSYWTWAFVWEYEVYGVHY